MQQTVHYACACRGLGFGKATSRMFAVLQAASEASPRKQVYPRNTIYISLCGHRMWSVRFVHPQGRTGSINRERLCLSCRDGLRWGLTAMKCLARQSSDGGQQMGSESALPFSPCWRHDLCVIRDKSLPKLLLFWCLPWVPKGKVEVPWLDLPIALNLQRTNFLRLGMVSLSDPHRCEIWPSMQIISGLNCAWGWKLFAFSEQYASCIKWDGDFPPLLDIPINN